MIKHKDFGADWMLDSVGISDRVRKRCETEQQDRKYYFVAYLLVAKANYVDFV